MRLIDADALIESMGLENAVKWGNKDSYQRDHSYSTMMLYEIKGAIDWAPTVGGWISVKDRLPEKSGSYLCFMADYPFGPGYMIVNYRKEKGAFWWFEDNVKAPFITHWMPLPEAPKEDSDGHG